MFQSELLGLRVIMRQRWEKVDDEIKDWVMLETPLTGKIVHVTEASVRVDFQGMLLHVPLDWLDGVRYILQDDRGY